MSSSSSTSQTSPPAQALQQPGGETAVTTIPPGTPAPSMPAKPGEDRYDYDASTIVLVVQFRPVVAGQPRPVWVSVQNGVGNRQDFPLYRLLTEADLGGPFPETIQALLEELRHDLPRRKERSASRVAQVPQVSMPASRAGTKPIPQTRHQTHSEKPATPPLPVPTTTTPILKEQLRMDGLFDDLD